MPSSPLRAVALLTLATGCARAEVAAERPRTDPAAQRLLLTGARAPGGAPVELWLDGARLADPRSAPPGTPARDLGGLFVAPAVVDAHVHLTYVDRAYAEIDRCGRPEADCTAAEALRAAGVAGAVDLAAPLDGLPTDAAIRTRFSGPMLTAPGGYPLYTWGRDGYGAPVPDPGAAAALVEDLAARGATWVKLPLEVGPALDEATRRAIVAAAHARGLRVAAHTPNPASVAQAAALDVDLLAHVPRDPLDADTVAAWASRPGRAVVGTLSSFSGGRGAQDNLRRLHAAGVTVLYGTDLGNGNRPGISAEELLGLRSAGLAPAEVLAAATAAPAAYFGFEDLGRLEPSYAACVLVLDADPLEDVTALARPVEVLGAGCAPP